jgi:GT2 family glycosyltransferase
MSEKPDISIIIPTKDREAIFEKTFESAIKAIEGFNIEIIIVNDSKEHKVRLIEEHPNVTVVDNPKNGVASARNLGANIAKSNLLLFLDNDILISRNNIITTLELYKDNYQICYNFNWVYPVKFVGKMKRLQFGRYLDKHNFTSLRGWNKADRTVKWDFKRPFEVEMVASFYLPIYKSAFDKVGGFNENFPHSGAENYDFSKRFKAAGYKIFIHPSSMVYHYEIDRIEIDEWLNRKVREGETRKVAVEIGYEELRIAHGSFKRTILKFGIKRRKFFKWILSYIPNNHIYDGIYFKIVNYLLSVSLYEGYTRK